MTGMGDDVGLGSTTDGPGAVMPARADVEEARAARVAFRTARCGLCLVMNPDAALCEHCTGVHHQRPAVPFAPRPQRLEDDTEGTLGGLD